jgi:hypothetical protein
MPQLTPSPSRCGRGQSTAWKGKSRARPQGATVRQVRARARPRRAARVGRRGCKGGGGSSLPDDLGGDGAAHASLARAVGPRDRAKGLLTALTGAKTSHACRHANDPRDKKHVRARAQVCGDTVCIGAPLPNDCRRRRSTRPSIRVHSTSPPARRHPIERARLSYHHASAQRMDGEASVRVGGAHRRARLRPISPLPRTPGAIPWSHSVSYFISHSRPSYSLAASACGARLGPAAQWTARWSSLACGSTWR